MNRKNKKKKTKKKRRRHVLRVRQTPVTIDPGTQHASSSVPPCCTCMYMCIIYAHEPSVTQITHECAQGCDALLLVYCCCTAAASTEARGTINHQSSVCTCTYYVPYDTMTESKHTMSTPMHDFVHSSVSTKSKLDGGNGTKRPWISGLYRIVLYYLHTAVV